MICSTHTQSVILRWLVLLFKKLTLYNNMKLWWWEVVEKHVHLSRRNHVSLHLKRTSLYMHQLCVNEELKMVKALWKLVFVRLLTQTFLFFSSGTNLFMFLSGIMAQLVTDTEAIPRFFYHWIIRFTVRLKTDDRGSYRVTSWIENMSPVTPNDSWRSILPYALNI